MWPGSIDLFNTSSIRARMLFSLPKALLRQITEVPSFEKLYQKRQQLQLLYRAPPHPQIKSIRKKMSLYQAWIHLFFLSFLHKRKNSYPCNADIELCIRNNTEMISSTKWVLHKHYVVLCKGLAHMWILVSSESWDQWPKNTEGWLYASVGPPCPWRTLITLVEGLLQRFQL